MTECLHWRLIPAHFLDKYRLVLKEESEKHSLGHQNLQTEHLLACVQANLKWLTSKTQKSFHHRRRAEIRNVLILEWSAEFLRESTKDRLDQH